MAQVIAVYGASGGIGCTTIAVNLASGLRQRETVALSSKSVSHSDSRILLIDLNLFYGNVSTALNLSKVVNLAEFWNEELDEASLQSAIAYDDKGMHVLTMPSNIQDAQRLLSEAEIFRRLISLVEKTYEFIIIDTGHYLNEFTWRALDWANIIVLVMTPILTSIYNARRALELFDEIAYPYEKISLVLNRIIPQTKADSKKSFATAEEIEKMREILKPRTSSDNPTNKNAGGTSQETVSQTNINPVQKFHLNIKQIERYLKRPIEAQILVDEITALTALNKGTSILALPNSDQEALAQAFESLLANLYLKLEGKELPDQLDFGPWFTDSAIRYENGHYPIKVFVANAIWEAAENFKKLLLFEEDFQVIGVATNLNEAIEQIANLKPRVILMGYNLLGTDYPITLGKIRNECSNSKIIVTLPVNSSDLEQQSVLLSGADDFVDVGDSDTLYSKVRKVARP